jgi:hypothetical protein
MSTTKKMTAGDDLHLCLLGVPMHWHMLTGKDYQDMIAFGRAVWNAATEHAAKLAWQPIETAPKDGTMFLCWVGAERWSAIDGEGSGRAHDVSQIDFCWWRRVHESPDGGYFDNASGQFGDSQGVTHWMPLPDAPCAAAIRAGGEQT